MGTDGRNHEKNSTENVRNKREEATFDMFDLLKDVGKSSAVRDERLDVGGGLSRFKQETGVDFLDLLNDKQLRAKFLVGNGSRDTDEDEKEIQNFFEAAQKKIFRNDI